MWGWQGSRPLRFGVAIAGVLYVAVLRWALTPYLGQKAAYLPFAPVIMAVVLVCGPAPAAVASLLALGFGLYFSGSSAIGPADQVNAAIFFAVAGGMVLLGEIINRVRRQLVTSYQRAQHNARASKQLAEELNLLIDGAQGHAIYMLDGLGHVTIWNKGAERLKGWTEEEVVGKHCSMFYPLRSLAIGKAEADMTRARREGRFESEEWRLRKDGSEFLAAVSLTALFDDDGALRGFAKVITDITRQRAAQDRLRARENLLTSILATVPDAMVVIDARGEILSFSDAARQMFGYEAMEVIGSNVSILMTSPDAEQHDAHLRRYLNEGDPHVIGKVRFVHARHRDGREIPVELSIGEARDGGTHVFTAVMRDLTERLEAQAELERLQSELIHVARMSAMGTMASTLAHELNQPIAAVVNYVQSVRGQMGMADAATLPMLRDALDEAAQEALRAGQILRRLRDFVTRGHIERAIEDLPLLIQESCVLALMGAEEKGIHVSFDLHPQASPVFVDRVQIQQVLLNLIRNACDAMEQSARRELVVSTRPDVPGMVRVTVADTGPGLAVDIRDRLFSAFTTTKPDGMGVGLSICRTIVEANEGRIWAESTTGKGTRFHFTMPRLSED
ncbi:PAS domain-containing sensor histidine kinase [Novosphingobium rosa]|uniref:PAS domain-containing sensor histidine kinase n=1 Tax=Novosphingobium rosa TaxID=76978 RepID=UPI000832DC7E|nr:PAS domain S-box protein [Novosphingobium rosa]